MSHADPRARRLQLFTGKGGVGKTTVVLACAMAWAERGRRPLVVELGRRASVDGALGVKVGWDPMLVAPGVHATNVDADRAILEVLARWIPLRGLARRVMRAELMQAFLGAAPAVVEVATIERLLALLEQDWDPILVDADATGHARMFLGLPAVFEELGAAGPLAASLERTRGLFADPALAALHLVTLPGALPIQETLELDAALREDRHVALGAVFVNRAPSSVGAIDGARVAQLAERVDADLGSALRAVADDESRKAAERVRIARLRASIARPIVELAEAGDPALGFESLREIGRAALEGCAT